MSHAQYEATAVDTERESEKERETETRENARSKNALEVCINLCYAKYLEYWLKR